MDEKGFQQSPSTSNLYVKSIGNDIILLVIYVDDIIIMGSEASAIQHIKYNMSKSFDMIDLDFIHYCLGVEVWETCSNIFVSQTKHVRSFLDKFIMIECKFLFTLMEKVLKLSTNIDSRQQLMSYFVGI